MSSIPRLNPGQPIPAIAWNNMADMVESFVRSTGGGGAFNGPGAFALNQTPAPYTRFGIFHVTAVGDDYLTTNMWAGPGSMQDYVGPVYVAKPPDLQRTPLEGWTINGLAYSFATVDELLQMTTTRASDSTTEAHLITPTYWLPDTAAKDSTGATVTWPGCLVIGGVANPAPGILGGDGNPIAWIDVNWAGRGWGMVST